MKVAKLRYKCRSCGSVYIESGIAAEKVSFLIAYYLNDMEIPSKYGVFFSKGPHKCSDTEFGISDFIGYVIVEE